MLHDVCMCVCDLWNPQKPSVAIIKRQSNKVLEWSEGPIHAAVTGAGMTTCTVHLM